jgi:hypothetical protein
MKNNYLMPDYATIGATAQVLATSEMRLLELAYQQWFGHAPTR